jgi:glycosyltransferase involved in cell wall biosynthesis
MRAIALIERPGHVCARYRFAAFASALGDAGCSLTFAAIPRIALGRLLLFSKLGGFDTVLLQRRLLPTYQLKYLRHKSRRLIFDFDDAVFCRDSYSLWGIASTKRERRFRNIMSAADEVIAGNGFLKERAVASGAEAGSVHVIPTCVDPSRYPLADHHSKEVLNLVWVGSSSTLQGIEMRRRLFEKLSDRFPNVRLRLICDRFPDFARPPMESILWSEANESAEIAVGDIGISWVPDDLWSTGKCGLKILQYYAAGLPVIANSVGVHAEMIQSGITGLLADTDEQWIDAICTLSQPETRRRMGKAARKCVEQRYSVAAHRHRFVDIVTR